MTATTTIEKTWEDHNGANGKPDSHAERMDRIKGAAVDPMFADWTTARIAKHVGASSHTIKKYRQQESTLQSAMSRTGADGRTYKPRAPDPAKEAEKAKEKAETAVANAKAKLAEKVVAAAALGVDTDAVAVEEAAPVVRST